LKPCFKPQKQLAYYISFEDSRAKAYTEKIFFSALQETPHPQKNSMYLES